MRNIQVFAIGCAILVALGFAAVPAKADTWQLTESNVDLGVSGNFVSVSITVTGDTATFTVTANSSLLNAGSNFGIEKFGFNTSLNNISPCEISLQNGWSVKTNQQLDGFGSFQFETKGYGYSRMQQLSFSITDPSINSAAQFYAANSQGYDFAAEVAGFNSTTGQTSAFFSDDPDCHHNVPEPSAMFLVGPCLAGLVVFNAKLRT
jgi:hypothetical protein